MLGLHPCGSEALSHSGLVLRTRAQYYTRTQASGLRLKLQAQRRTLQLSHSENALRPLAGAPPMPEARGRSVARADEIGRNSEPQVRARDPRLSRTCTRTRSHAHATTGGPSYGAHNSPAQGTRAFRACFPFFFSVVPSAMTYAHAMDAYALAPGRGASGLGPSASPHAAWRAALEPGLRGSA